MCVARRWPVAPRFLLLKKAVARHIIKSFQHLGLARLRVKFFLSLCRFTGNNACQFRLFFRILNLYYMYVFQAFTKVGNMCIDFRFCYSIVMKKYIPRKAHLWMYTCLLCMLIIVRYSKSVAFFIMLCNIFHVLCRSEWQEWSSFRISFL